MNFLFLRRSINPLIWTHDNAKYSPNFIMNDLRIIRYMIARE
jgi:hypothetical protein